MRIQILDYQVGPHTFRMVKPSDFNIFKALPSLIPFITTIDTTQKVIFETEIDDDETTTKRTIAKTPDDICFNWEDADCIIRPLPTAHTLYPSPHGKAGKTIGWSATITSGNASSTYRPAGQKHRLRKTKRTSY